MSLKIQKKKSKKASRFCVSCRNHSIKVSVTGHRNVCPFTGCKCELCKLTNKVKFVSLKERKIHKQMDKQSHLGWSKTASEESEERYEPQFLPLPDEKLPEIIFNESVFEQVDEPPLCTDAEILSWPAPEYDWMEFLNL